MRRTAVLSSVVLVANIGLAQASDFDSFGAAEQDLIAPTMDDGFLFEFEVGGGAELAPAYEGSSTYEWGINPIIGVDRLRIPGLIDIGGDDEPGLSFSPAFDIIGERKSADYVELNGLNDVEATYALGAEIGYDFALNDQLTAGVYGELLYGFGGGQGLLGEVGAELTAELTPQFEIVGGVSANFASEGYMDAYFGVTAEESVRTSGRLAAYDPSAGVKSVSFDLSARYEFLEDTFLNVSGSYTQLVGDAASSPITQSGSERQFTVGLGISRKFGISY